MIPQLLTLAVCALGTCLARVDAQRLEGVVVNGSQGGVPVAGAEVVLRAGEEGTVIPVAQTITDQNGRFVFDNLPIEQGLIYLAGANRHGIHYPGTRFRAAPGVLAPVRLTVFDAVGSPSPLVAVRHEIDIEVKPGVLEISETLVVSNPTLTAYVGETRGDAPPETLVLQIPGEFERVTFASEFHGRNFRLADGRLTTSLPWPPGKRELKFTYHLPAEGGRHTLERPLDLPCSLARVRVRGENADRVKCDLPRVASPDRDAVVFESSGTTLAAGHAIWVQFGNLATPWIVYARWTALAIFGGAVLATAWFRARRGVDSLPAGRVIKEHSHRIA